MENILETIAAFSKERVRLQKENTPLESLKEKCRDILNQEALQGADAFPFETALKKPGISFICEVKKASPSKGVIAEDFPYVQIARDYEKAGADCISCLTEPKWFLGSDDIFREIRKNVHIPMLRKDFTVDEYQIYQARLMGADAVLLICALLDEMTLEKYLGVCEELRLSALVEAHDEREIKTATACGARIIGVNNRNLRDFSVDTGNAVRLKGAAPCGAVFVAESGIKTAADVKEMADAGIDAALVGETLMRAENKSAKLTELRSLL